MQHMREDQVQFFYNGIRTLQKHWTNRLSAFQLQENKNMMCVSRS